MITPSFHVGKLSKAPKQATHRAFGAYSWCLWRRFLRTWAPMGRRLSDTCPAIQCKLKGS